MVREDLTKVAIVADNDDACWFLQRILQRPREFRCAGCYASAEEAILEVPRARPRAVLMSIQLPGISGIECTRLLKGLLPGLGVVLLSRIADLETISAAVEGVILPPGKNARLFGKLQIAARFGVCASLFRRAGCPALRQARRPPLHTQNCKAVLPLGVYGETARTRKNCLAWFVYGVNHSDSGKSPARFVRRVKGAPASVPANTS